MIISHRDTLCIECIRFNDVSTCFQIFPMNILNDLRSRQTQKVIITLHLSGLFHESPSPEIFFGEVVFLYHGSQCTVQHKDALPNQFPNALHKNQCLNMRSISRRSSFSLMD